MKAITRLTPYVVVGLWLALFTVAADVTLTGLAQTSVLGWLPKTVVGTGYLEDSRHRVSAALQEYRRGRAAENRHLAAVVGISNVRQGVELSVISDLAGPNWRFLGLGGAGLGIREVARYADVLLASELRPDVVVLGMSLHHMVDTRPKPGLASIGAWDYLRAGDLRNAAIEVRNSVWVYSRRQDVTVSVQKAVLDTRARLFGLFGQALPEDEAIQQSPWREMIKSDWPEHFSSKTLKEEEEFFADLGVFDLKTYQNAPAASATLVSMIERIRQQRAEPLIVLMPEHSTLQRRVPAGALEIVKGELQRLAGGLPPILDFRGSLDDESFVDLSHLNRKGSFEFSRMLGTEMRKLLPNRPSLMATRD